MNDAESLEVLRRVASGEAGLPPQLASRVSGATIGELRKDARQLALDLGLAESQPRGPDGRFVNMTDRIRQAAGRSAGSPSTRRCRHRRRRAVCRYRGREMPCAEPARTSGPARVRASDPSPRVARTGLTDAAV
jgi:hypothetical protein